MHSSAGTLFGVNNSNNATATPSLSFGSTNTTSNSSFGGSLFGGSNSTTATSASTLSFGAKSAATSAPFGSSLFGTNNATTATSASTLNFGATKSTTGSGFGSGSFGASSTAPTLTSQPVFGSNSSSTATTTQATGFGFNSSFGGSSSLFGGGASKPSGFGFGAGTSTSFGLSATPASAQNSYPHLSAPPNATDLKYQQLYESAYRASCEKSVKDTTLIRDLPPKLQELCANLEKMQKDAITKRNALVESMIKTAPCLKVMESNTFDESIFSIPDQTEEVISQFRQFRQKVSSDKLTIEKLSLTTTELLSEVKRLSQLVNKVKATRNSNRSEDLNQNSFNRQKTFNRFLPPSLDGNSFAFSSSIPSVHPISKPTDFIEYFLDLEKTQESKILELNKQLMDIESKTDSFLHEWNQGLLKNKSPEEQYEASLQSAKNQSNILQIKIQESQSRILELRKLAYEAGIELQPSSKLENESNPFKKHKETSVLEKDPLNSIIFTNSTTTSKPGWDDVLYEIASTELVPSDLSKAKPA